MDHLLSTGHSPKFVTSGQLRADSPMDLAISKSLFIAEISFRSQGGSQVSMDCGGVREREVETATMETKLLMKGKKMQQKLAGSIDFKKISVLGLGVFVVVVLR